MVEAAPTGWLGVGRPVGPPEPWPRAMHRALPAPGRVSSSPTSRGVPSTVVGALDRAAAARSIALEFAEVRVAVHQLWLLLCLDW